MTVPLNHAANNVFASSHTLEIYQEKLNAADESSITLKHAIINDSNFVILVTR